MREWTRYTFFGLMSLVALLGISGNTLIISVLFKLRNKTSTDFYVLSMSVMDLISSSVSTTCYILRYEPNTWELLASSWFCRLHIFTIYLTNISTTSLLAATAYDRHNRTVNTLAQQPLDASTKAKRICVGILSSSFIYSLFFLLTTTLDSTTLKCSGMKGYSTMTAIFSSVLALVFVLMFVIVIVCYTRVAVMLRRHHRRIQRMKLKTNPMTIKTTREVPTLSGDNNMPQASTFGRKILATYTAVTKLQNEQIQFNEQDNAIVQSVAVKDNDSRGQTATNLHITPSCSKSIENNEVSLPGKIIRDEKPLPKHTAIDRDRRLMNRTTMMMFLITLVYIGTWIIFWSATAYKAATASPSLGLLFLSEKIYLINGMTNPIFYILMSSKFRQMAKDMICKP
ncbi:uncharacterized protein LOC123530549 [Mercenaria mercenaria]|uniref:uncharacterized protein LOC123530549 n=1 Tax=Mercenaria mercenaria TaxID=6596 RepID=UPI00234EE2FD|nr:uncharacterized protein LOC123530549 [Mercenaria mercenaria]